MESTVNGVLYFKITIYRVQLEGTQGGVIRLKGYFDHNFGIQLNLTGFHYALGQDGIILTKETNGLSVLTINYGNTNAFMEYNEEMSVSVKVVNSSHFHIETDGVFNDRKTYKFESIFEVDDFAFYEDKQPISIKIDAKHINP
ncbi:TPA: hypothetical protein QCU06_004980 [Bacillus cereus]|nr:hypothetical protein [Bacillus cereus]